MAIGERKREREKLRTAMIDTTRRQIYSEPYFLLFWWKLWYRAGSQPDGHLHLTQGWMSTHRLLSKWLTVCLSGVKKLQHYIFSGRPHIFPSCSIHLIHSPCLLFTLRHRRNILLTKSRINGCYLSICSIDR